MDAKCSKPLSVLKAGTASIKAQLSPPKQQLPPLGDSNSKLFSSTHLEKILIIACVTAGLICWETNLRYFKRFVLP